MPAARPPQQSPRGPPNDLYRAAGDGSTHRTLALLSSGLIDINQVTHSQRWTPLMYASALGHSLVARILLDRGANVSIVGGGGFTALHFAAKDGHLAVTEMLVKAGADFEATTYQKGTTPLHLAADQGRWEVMRALVEVGANVNTRRLDGETPLFSAAPRGHVAVVRELLRAKANPLLTIVNPSGIFLPLDVATQYGHPQVIR